MVGALKGALGLTAVLGAQLRAAMPADVEEGADLAAAGPGDQHALASDLNGLEGTGLVEVGGAHGAEPHRLEDLVLFHREDGGVGVVAAGQCRYQALGQADGGHRYLLCWFAG